MVAMGGGPEGPIREGERSQNRELLLAVLPWPQEKPQKIIKEIEAEFPNLDIHFVHEVYENRADRGKVEVPEGNDMSALHRRHLPSFILQRLRSVSLHRSA